MQRLVQAWDMKKKFISNTIFMISVFMFSTSSSYSIFDAELGIGYAGLTYKDNGSPTSLGSIKENSLKGLVFQGAAHLNFSIPSVISIGIGPYAVTGSDLTFSGTAAGVTYSGSLFTIGGEAKAKLLIVPVVSPYMKAGLGSDTVRVDGTASGVKVEILKMTGLSYRIMAGLEFPIVPLVFIFGEAGFTGTSYEASVIGISGFKTASTGYQINFGAGISL